MKLTQAQRRVLEKLATGDDVYAGMGNIRHKWSRSPVNILDIAALNQAGLAERDCSARHFVIHRITDKGRRVLGEG